MSDYDAEYRKAPALFGSECSPLLKAYGHLIPEPRRVLDIGVGQGRNAIALAKSGCRVTGIDPSEVAIEMTAALFHNAGHKIELWKGSVFDYEAGRGSFDTILVFGLIQTLTRQQTSDLLARVDHWLSSNGLLFVTAWHTDDPRYATISESWNKLEKHSFQRNDGEIRTFLEPDEILTLFERFSIVHHWEGLGPEHRHGDSPPERHGAIDFVAQKED